MNPTDNNIKLSVPQKRLLERLKQGNVHCVSYYKPAIALVQKGLARWVTARKFPTGSWEVLSLNSD